MADQYGADQIEILSGVEAIRRRGSLYIGSLDIKGLHVLLNEVINNSVEEAIASYCNKIKVVLNSDNSVTVTDNGRGIPTDINYQTNKSAIECMIVLTC